MKLKNTIDLSESIKDLLEEKNMSLSLHSVAIFTLFIDYIATYGEACEIDGKTIYFCKFGIDEFAKVTGNSKTSVWTTFKQLVEAGIIYKKVILYPYTEWGIDLKPFCEK